MGVPLIGIGARQPYGYFNTNSFIKLSTYGRRHEPNSTNAAPVMTTTQNRQFVNNSGSVDLFPGFKFVCFPHFKFAAFINLLLKQKHWLFEYILLTRVDAPGDKFLQDLLVFVYHLNFNNFL